MEAAGGDEGEGDSSEIQSSGKGRTRGRKGREGVEGVKYFGMGVYKACRQLQRC